MFVFFSSGGEGVHSDCLGHSTYLLPSLWVKVLELIHTYSEEPAHGQAQCEEAVRGSREEEDLELCSGYYTLCW